MEKKSIFTKEKKLTSNTVLSYALVCICVNVPYFQKFTNANFFLVCFTSEWNGEFLLELYH